MAFSLFGFSYLQGYQTPSSIYTISVIPPCKQSGVYIFGVIASSSYSAPNTTITLIVNTDYTLSTATITDAAISYIENPEGFPSSFNYTPSLSCGGSMIVASSTINTAKWWTYGNHISFMVDIDVSFGGTANSLFKVSPPVAPTVINIPFPANCRDTSSGILPVGTGAINSVEGLKFRKADISNWTIGITQRVFGHGQYIF